MEESVIDRSELVRIGALLRAAREAAGLNQGDAFKLAGGLSEGTIRGWERGRGEGQWARILLWLRAIVTRSPLAARFILQLLGLREELAVREPEPEFASDPEFGEWLKTARFVWEHREDNGLRNAIGTIVEVVDMYQEIQRLSGEAER